MCAMVTTTLLPKSKIFVLYDFLICFLSIFLAHKNVQRYAEYVEQNSLPIEMFEKNPIIKKIVPLFPRILRIPYSYFVNKKSASLR